MRANPSGHADCDENPLSFFPPVRFPGHRRQLVQSFVERFSLAFSSSMIAFSQGLSQALQGEAQLFSCRCTEQVVLVVKVLFAMPQEQLAVLDVTRGEHG